ncbi:hypothetical protein FOA52_012020 [Chlamydomonas sp. UWO 241]|nr:hypothetical protein FOA52_012020 [Chlamydomonas sp. UWO 241]
MSSVAALTSYNNGTYEGDEEAPAAAPRPQQPRTPTPQRMPRAMHGRLAPSGAWPSPPSTATLAAASAAMKKHNRVAPVPVAEAALGMQTPLQPQRTQHPHASAAFTTGDGIETAAEDAVDKQEVDMFMSMSRRMPPLPPPPNSINVPPDYVLLDDTMRCPIRVRTHIMSIHNIDTVSQSFDCKLWLQLSWFTTRRDITDFAKDGDPGEWKPRLTFLDAIGEPVIFESKVPREQPCPDSDKMLISCRWVVSGTFSEKMELLQFPVDHQKLHIRAAVWDSPSYIVTEDDESSRPTSRRAFERSLKFYRDQSFVYDEAFVQSDAWTLDPTLYVEQDVSRHERHDENIQFPILNIYMVVKRRPAPFDQTRPSLRRILLCVRRSQRGMSGGPRFVA